MLRYVTRHNYLHIFDFGKIFNYFQSIIIVDINKSLKYQTYCYLIRQINTMKLLKVLSILTIFLGIGCASYEPQLITNPKQETTTKEVEHTFYIAGGYGNSKTPQNTATLELFKNHLSKSDKNSTVIFTGDNISGIKKNTKQDKKIILDHLEALKSFEGKTVFLSGMNEWKSKDAEMIKDIEDFIQENKKNADLFPAKSCPIEQIELNAKLDLIVINSSLLISNWDRLKNVNKRCESVNTMRRFSEELEGYINDGQNKNIIIAMHHPILSNGKYAGNSTVKENMLPLPVLGTVIEGIEELGAFSPNFLNFRRYNALRVLVSSIAQDSDRVTVVSGHEQSLQYLTGNRIQQIISGSLGEAKATRRTKDVISALGGTLNFEGQFTYGKTGFTKLEYFTDGSSKVTFITGDKDKKYMFDVLPAFQQEKKFSDFDIPKEKTISRAIISDSTKLKKSGLYNFFWGKHHRKYYGKPVEAPVALLDTLYGGLTVVKKGGGHQSYSLRLEDKNGKQYAMRSLRKRALRFLKFILRGIAYNQSDFEDSIVEQVVSDFFTTSHPYMQLIVDPLAEAAKVNHAKTQLYYIPKQEALGSLNEDYGGELYYIEERPSGENMDYRGYNRVHPELKVDDFESTTDVLDKIKKDRHNTIEQRSYIRARLFDMLIGDWDRHNDQWRWAEYQKTGKSKEYAPIPRDRDNTFPKYDGLAVVLSRMLIPDTRFWQTYQGDIKSVKWLNAEANNLDRAILNQYGAEIWREEATFIKQAVTEEVINRAFARLPDAIQDDTAEQIKKALRERLQRLPQYAFEYGEYLNKVVAIHGTRNKDIVEIERLPEGKTRIKIQNPSQKEANEFYYDRTFDRTETKEIWIYGLNKSDTFKVSGEGNKQIKIRIVGGYGEDTYIINNTNKLKIYDFRYETSNFTEDIPKKQLTNRYETNTFHWRYFKENSNIVLPQLGFRVDDGFFIGATDTYTVNGFNGSPFRRKHTVSANYYFTFPGIELSYQGIFANIFPNWNFEVNGYFTNERFANNFFGFGNETINNNNDDLDFNRARTKQLKFDVGINYQTLYLKALFESYKVEQNSDRFFTPDNVNPLVFDNQNYAGAEAGLRYKNEDAIGFPTKALYLSFKAGFLANTDLEDNRFGYLVGRAGFSRKLIASGDIVLSSVVEGRTNIGDDFFFYHGASIGGNNGLRGFRNERFTGKSYLYQSTDIRLRLTKYKTSFLPVTIGVYGGFDYGRVWVENDTSKKWNTSQGGGLWLQGLNQFSLHAGFFNSKEINMLQVGLGMDF